MRGASQVFLFLLHYTLSGQWAIENIWRPASSLSLDLQYNRMTIGTHPLCSVLVCISDWGDFIFLPISSGEQRSRNKWLSVFHHMYQMWLARWKTRGFWWVRYWASILYHECIVDDLNNLRLFFLPGFFLGKVVDGLLVMRKIEVKKKAILFNV